MSDFETFSVVYCCVCCLTHTFTSFGSVFELLVLVSHIIILLPFCVKLGSNFTVVWVSDKLGRAQKPTLERSAGVVRMLNCVHSARLAEVSAQVEGAGFRTPCPFVDKVWRGGGDRDVFRACYLSTRGSCGSFMLSRLSLSLSLS